MWRRAGSAARRVMVGLLMLATLLGYAAPTHAGPTRQHHPAGSHEHVMAGVHDHAAPAVDGHGRGQARCKDFGLLDNGACCGVAQCVAMHGGLPAASFEAFIPDIGASVPPAVHRTPEGIDVDPALRPPCLTV